MLTTASGAEFVRAYQILFNPEDSVFRGPFSMSFFKSLDPSAVKNAFRKKALETHPDRARALGREEVEQADLFRQVKQAYEVLMPVAENKDIRKPGPGTHSKNDTANEWNPNRKKQETKSKKNARDFKPVASFYHGAIPLHRLRLGHYLYYSGIISWQNLINAVAFQMRAKPRYGEIAVGWKMISRDALMVILSDKTHDGKIGERLRYSGLISDFQHLAILGKQRKHHCLFGEYFVNQGILSQRQLDIALRRAEQHNRTIERFRREYRM